MSKIIYKTDFEVELIKESSLLVAKTLGEIAKIIAPGVQTITLDKLAETFIKDHQGIPAFKGYHGFPATLCISINEQVVHGFPSSRVLKEGDIVSVDCGVIKNEFYGDSAFTFAVGEISQDNEKLLRVTEESLYKGIEVAIVGKRLGDIGFEIQKHAELNGFSVVRELVGHGVGKKLHEEPQVPNYGKKDKGLILNENLVIAIEPMINMGKHNVYQESDGWTIRTADKLPSAHFEHTIVVKQNKAEILSSFEYIYQSLGNKNF